MDISASEVRVVIAEEAERIRQLQPYGVQAQLTALEDANKRFQKFVAHKHPSFSEQDVEDWARTIAAQMLEILTAESVREGLRLKQQLKELKPVPETPEASNDE